MWDTLRSALLWAAIGAVTAGFFPVALVTSALAWLAGDRRRRSGHLWASLWGRTVVAISPAWSCEVDGPAPPDRPFVIVANHESMGDIMTAFHLRHHFKWIAKDTIFRVPLLGWFMPMAGYISIKRGSPASARKCMEKARAWLERGVSVLFFAEGTRSTDGGVQPFKPGAFKLAVATGVDVLPAAFSGTRENLRKQSWRFGRTYTRMRLRVGTPIPVAGLCEEDVKGLAERARAQVIVLKRALEDEASDPSGPVSK